MSLREYPLVQAVCRWSTVSLGTLCLVVIAIAFAAPEGGQVTGLIVRQKAKPLPWRVLETEEVQNGVLIPENSNIVFHLPLNLSDTDREVLLGHQGKKVRYWGYCFPQNYDPQIAKRRTGFPGLIFLSEKEREMRTPSHAAAGQPSFSIYELPTKEDIDRPGGPKSSIRNQIEVFGAGMMCYVMTEKPLALGPDEDEDRLNAELEHEIGTNRQTPDTDSDGINDGVEYLTGTNPLLRDTDADSLVEGLEDKNWNGKQDRGETDPRARDSDRDGLCDGICRVKLGNGKSVFLGEDLNLNGRLDQGETDPLKFATRGNYNDYSWRINCMNNNNQSEGCK